MSSCGQCNESIDRRKSSSITCSGFCNQLYHLKCLGISTDILQHLKSPGVCWYCPECLKLKNTYDSYMKNSFDSKMTQLINDFELMFSDLKKQILEKADNSFAQMSEMSLQKKKIEQSSSSYANIVSSKSVVVIKPKNTDQSNAKTKSDIMKNIDPVDNKLKVSRVKQIKDGGILISCDDNEGTNNLKNVASKKLSSHYEISEVKKLLPKIRIVGLMESYASDDVIKFLKGQNDVISDDSHVRILKIWATKKDPSLFQALVELDAATFGLVMDRGKLFVNYDVCSVYEANDVKICFKCSGFNHGQTTCRSNTIVCPKCSGKHVLNECTNPVLKCINCTNAKFSDNSHVVWDADKCPIYKKKLDHIKSTNFVNK